MLDEMTVLRRGVAYVLFLGALAKGASAFSAPSYSLSERFRASCPADLNSIRQYDPSLLPSDGDDAGTWVAVFRSSNNLPSVLIRDDLMNAMRIATTVQTDSAAQSFQSSSQPSGLETPDTAGGGGEEGGEGVKASTPIAVARLRKSEDFPDRYVIDSMRCSLKKEDLNEDCDGGSEYCEAVSVCIDELLLNRLKSPDCRFDGAVRCKATLHTGKLLETRGFAENPEFSKDMATHISSLDGSMDRYAERAVSQAAKNTGARDRALQILSNLGRLNRQEDIKKGKENGDAEKDGEDDYDPWAGSQIFKR
mmetsp:Transcript_5557/g.16137  ORF Transcript_5557/g.16137 Transcript_5557/m.16137 type:complete len:308 (-) Transcript_5557:339-1262(-)